MAERPETSVMASIQDILRDAQSREEQDKQEAEQRARDEEKRLIDEQRKRQQDEEARLRSEEDERMRRSHEEQRRQAEIQAMQEATVQRARAEAEAQARLAEMTARQEHERHLHTIGQDKHKKRLTMILMGLGAFVVIGGIVGGVAIKRSMDENAALKVQQAQLQAQIDDSNAKEAKLQAELANAKDPAEVAALQAQLDAEKQRNSQLQTQASTKKPTSVGGPGPGPGPKPGGGGPAKPCNCTPGDPLCSCL
jgi:colicin import membrane protein